MNVTFKPGDTLDGWVISKAIGLSWFIARRDNIILCFESEAGAGNNYFRVLWYTDMRTRRQYKAERFTSRYLHDVKKLSDKLYKRYQKENTLWSRVTN